MLGFQTEVHGRQWEIGAANRELAQILWTSTVIGDIFQINVLATAFFSFKTDQPGCSEILLGRTAVKVPKRFSSVASNQTPTSPGPPSRHIHQSNKCISFPHQCKRLTCKLIPILTNEYTSAHAGSLLHLRSLLLRGTENLVNMRSTERPRKLRL